MAFLMITNRSLRSADDFSGQENSSENGICANGGFKEIAVVRRCRLHLFDGPGATARHSRLALLIVRSLNLVDSTCNRSQRDRYSQSI